MIRQLTRVVFFTVLASGVAADGSAQALEWQGRGYFNVDFGFQNRSQEFGDGVEFTIYEETAAFAMPYDLEGGSVIDLSGGVRVWKNLAVGVGYSRFGDTTDTLVTVRVPHPLLFNAPRSATAGVGNLDHTQQAIHLLLSWHQPFSDRFEVALFAGPAFFNVKHPLVASVEFAEVGAPFTSITLRSVPAIEIEETATGVTIGTDLSYLATPRLGAGLFLRYSGASVDLALPVGGGRADLDLGGFQIGVGARVRF